MRKTITMQITVIRAAVLAVSAAVALLASDSCNASCGEYVYSRYRAATHQVLEVSRHVAISDYDIWQSELVVSAEQHGVSHEAILPVPIPCSGPDCRQSPTPSLPVAPPTTVTSGHQDRLICGQLAVELPSEVSRRRDLNAHARALRGFPLLIEMPPEFVG